MICDKNSLETKHLIMFRHCPKIKDKRDKEGKDEVKEENGREMKSKQQN